MYLQYALFISTCLGQKSYCACAVSRDLRVGGQKQPHIWNPRPHIIYSLYHFQGATVMIKGTLLLSIPIIKHFGRKFSKSENAYFLLSFSDPLEKPLDRYSWKLRTTPSQWGPSFCHIWRQSTFGRFKDYSFNKKIKITQAIYNSLPYRHMPYGRL